MKLGTLGRQIAKHSHFTMCHERILASHWEYIKSRILLPYAITSLSSA